MNKKKLTRRVGYWLLSKGCFYWTQGFPHSRTDIQMNAGAWAVHCKKQKQAVTWTENHDLVVLNRVGLVMFA